MRKILYKGDHTYVAQSLNGVGFGYEALRNYVKAAEYYTEALAMALRLVQNKTQAHLGEYQKNMINIIGILSERESVLGTKAVQELQNLYETKLGKEDERTIEFLTAIGRQPTASL